MIHSRSFGKTINTFHLFRHIASTHYQCDAPVLHHGEHRGQKANTIKAQVSQVEHNNSKFITLVANDVRAHVRQSTGFGAGLW